MKKYVALMMVLVIICLSTIVYADFTDVPKNSAYADAANRLNSIGIMTATGKDSFKPQDIVTREQFAMIMVKASGLADTAESLKGSTVFSDVSPSGSSSGYIAVALQKGYVSGMADGKFHPKEKITYAQVCTAVVKALGYTDQDVTGLWPKNYIEKASKLGLTKDIKLKSTDGVQRWALALIIDRLLDTNVKKASSAEADKKFADASGLFTQAIILGNSKTSDKLADNQIQTDKGIFYLKDSKIKLELGSTYRLDIDNDTIIAAYNSMKTVENISVENAVNSRITYKINDEMVSRTLPEKTTYYYNGAKQDYDNIKNIIKTRSSIVFTLNKEKSGYEYAVIFDPVYSKPEVARNFDPSNKRLGSIDLSVNPTVIREGALSDIMQIQEKDVVYKVSDIWNKYGYILAVKERVGGKITAILPDKISPKTLEIDGVKYDFSENIEFNKLNFTPGSFDVDDIIVAMLGHDGKIVDLDFPGSENNSDYALVLSTSSKVSSNTNGTLAVAYFAKLLTADGLTFTCEATADAPALKGKLVRYSWVDSQKVELEAVSYNFPNDVNVNKKERYFGADYVADNVKIFNIISDDAGSEVQAKLLNFEDLSEGEVANGKVYYVNKTGAFEDINVILTNDIFNEKYKTAIIKSISASTGSRGTTSYQYTLIVDGKEYQYNKGYINNGSLGSVIDVKMSSNTVDSIISTRNADITSTSVQAFDSKRIKLNNKVLWFNKNISVYFTDYAGNVTPKTIADLSVNELYGNISIYLDKPLDQGGKVEVIVVKQ